MCGFAGFLDRPGHASAEEMAALARAMADSIRHRGPDSEGAWVDAEAGIAFGHRRLAIVDLSSQGAQPMTSADGRYVIVYNGEVYNFPALRTELAALGHCFNGHSDTEVMLSAIQEWGLEAALSRFVGMFAFARWDRRRRELHLVRDRLGIKPLYYAELGGLALFGSELRALRRHPEFVAEIDRDVLSLYLERSCIPAPFTIFDRVAKVMPGTILTIGAEDRRPRSRTFWSLRDVVEAGAADPFDGTEDEAVEELERLLSEAVSDRLIADVPLGVFLSGGVDSSTVAALMQRMGNGKAKTFSIGFHDAVYDEGKDAAAVARHLGTEHHELTLGEDDALAVVPELATMFDEPFADSSQIPTFLVSKMARRDVTVALSGDGGDEVFGGYNRYLWVNGVSRWNGLLPRPLRAPAAKALKAVPQGALDRLGRLLRQRTAGEKVQKLASVLEAGDEAAIYRRLISHCPDAERLVVEGHKIDDLPMRPADWAELPNFTDQMMYLDAMTYLPDDILTKVDRASMAVSLEARVPLLDHRVVAFAWRLPQAMKIDGGIGKRLLRRVLYRHVPRELVERPKMGFAVPLHDWLRGPLRDWAEDLLAEDRLRREGFLAPEPIRRAWQEHLEGKQNRHHHLWDVLSFQAWHAASA
ncbi:MAG: asparagine synthase (glutamine-hydrolyzing) [Alphaproteobacteria bacterium]|nr:asparagine synthase (glutamine-hydrolyzing) [Alphaproteobacteria bacterium]